MTSNFAAARLELDVVKEKRENVLSRFNSPLHVLTQERGF